MMRSGYTLSVLTLVLMLIAIVAYADQDQEKRYLAKVHHELKALKPFLDRAKENAPTNARYRFDHERLSLILKRLMLDIELHMNSEKRAPYKSIAPSSSDQEPEKITKIEPKNQRKSKSPSQLADQTDSNQSSPGVE